jgi:PAS domain S-box-containing protein
MHSPPVSRRLSAPAGDAVRPALAAVQSCASGTAAEVKQQHHLLEAAPDGIVMTQKSRITYVNRAAVALLGATAADQAVGRAFPEFLETTVPAMPSARLQKLMTSGHGGPLAAIGRLHRLDGQVAEIELLFSPCRIGRNAGALLILQARDTADSAVAALSAPAPASRLIGTAAALAYITPDRICRFVNPVHESWFGTDRDTVAELPPAPLWGAALQQMQETIETALNGTEAACSQQVMLAHGTCHLTATCLPDKAADGQLRGISILMIQRDAGPAVAQATSAFMRPLRNAAAPILLAQLDKHYRLRFANEKYCAGLELTATRNGGRRISDFVGSATFANLCRYAESARNRRATSRANNADASQNPLLLAAINDLTRLRRGEDQLYRREQEFKTLVENSPDVIARLGPDMRHLYVSPAIEATFGLSPVSCLGKTKAELGFPRPVVSAWDTAVGLAFESRHEQQFMFSQMLQQRKRFFSVRIIPEFDRDGKVESVLAITYDVTDRARLEQEREQLLEREREARIQAETAARARDEFLAIVSHELRGPLNGIQSWAHVLETFVRDSGSPRLAQRALHGIHTGVEQQVRLIEDLLDVTRMMSGRLRLVKRPFTVLPVVQAAVESVREAATSKNLTIHTDYKIATEKIDGDPDRVQQVIWNLMSNAIKFTAEHGQVDVNATCTETHLSVTVADNGLGIAPDFLPHIFDRFSQKDTSSTRGHSGLGLGLFLVRHLVELHGGAIQARSPGEGKGSTFSLFLPLRTVQEKYAAPLVTKSGPPGAVHSLAGLHILLLDDQEEAREALGAVLAGAGASVFTAGSTGQAFDWLAQVADSGAALPDVLICDIAMPGEDGYAALHRIRSWETPHQNMPLQRLPALALTAFSQAEDRIHALTAGFQMHLAKPVAPEELLLVLATMMPRG